MVRHKASDIYEGNIRDRIHGRVFNKFIKVRGLFLGLARLIPITRDSFYTFKYRSLNIYGSA